MSDTFKLYISNVEDFSWHLYEKDVIALFQDVSVSNFLLCSIVYTVLCVSVVFLCQLFNCAQ